MDVEAWAAGHTQDVSKTDRGRTPTKPMVCVSLLSAYIVTDSGDGAGKGETGRQLAEVYSKSCSTSLKHPSYAGDVFPLRADT